ncbi:molybdopterin-dependent oxidoreductase [Aromatoleum aromaticum]|uniref:p-cymene dehydrogenase subunit alpha n=1 Tax=Aromatoleum aromaticum TaxID=551760 RepID=A0A096ZNW8_9RHOO|nr:molybdopterin-dependent oxidoreductase [Aromatoleum aromaticum]AIS23703.1 p-cymene dehydrogenase subunit alpha [Aromatoleum aromaticum]NMG55175.1 molybdopterin-dependent oxidoreductase [Aromatoleum aromaticum]
MSVNFDRRNFLKGSAATVGGLSLPSFIVEAAEVVGGKSVPVFTSWKDVYRAQWTWDKVVRSTHHLNCWYQAHCSWDVYVKDGLVYREEQAGEYPQVNPQLPDFNPRGCQKGGCFSERMYDPTRIAHPLRRVGERGSGKWERVTWKEALDDIADTYLDVTINEGTDTTVWDLGPGIDLGSGIGAQQRFSRLTQSVSLDMNSDIGDSHRGAAEMFGKISFERSADDYFYSDLILIWAGNPLYTQIPNAHFYTAARYRGAKIISICPDYNASAIKSDLWIPIKPGTDAALALSVCREIIEGGHVDKAFVKDQTDLPLLVRSDTRMFLTQTDVQADGRDDHMMLWDAKSNSLKTAPFKTLALGDLDPELEVKRTITLKDGKELEVRSVFSLLRDRLSVYTPENASKMCGVSPKMIRHLVKEITSVKAVCGTTQSCLNKYYHGNLMERSIAMVYCLTGNMGRKGAGFVAFPLLTPDGADKFSVSPSMKEVHSTFEPFEKMAKQRMDDGETFEMIVNAFGRAMFKPGTSPVRLPLWGSGQLFWQVHGEGEDLLKNSDSWNLGLKRPHNEYLDESLGKKWQPLHPPAEREPRILISLVSNPLRRKRNSQQLLTKLWPKLKKIVVIDWRVNSTARHADYVLPACTWYENTNLKWVTTLSPYLTTTDQATPPLGESKSDWDIIVMLSRHIQERARARGIGSVKSPEGLEVKLNTLYDDLTMDGEFKEGDGEKVAKAIYELSTSFKKTSWEETKRIGFKRFEKVPEDPISVSNMCEIPENDSVVPLTFHVRDKMPYPTSSRRIQFYIDHILYDELDEMLPMHKEVPKIGGNYPLIVGGGHTRWSIHSAWRDSPMMLRLHRPDPYMLLSFADAKKRSIEDGDWIRVFNDTGSYNVRAKVGPSIQPGQTVIYHAWESYQFPGKGDMNSVTATPLNPTELAGGHPHLEAGLMFGQAGEFDRDTRVEVERLPGGERPT